MLDHQKSRQIRTTCLLRRNKFMKLALACLQQGFSAWVVCTKRFAAFNMCQRKISLACNGQVCQFDLYWDATRSVKRTNEGNFLSGPIRLRLAESEQHGPETPSFSCHPSPALSPV